MAIRYTFYTDRDDYSYVQSVEDSREWLRSRGKLESREVKPDGSMTTGAALDDLDELEIGRWVVAASMGIVARKAADRGYISFFTDRRNEWVSIYASRVQSIGAEVVDDDETEGDAPDDGGPQDATHWSNWTDEEPKFEA